MIIEGAHVLVDETVETSLCSVDYSLQCLIYYHVLRIAETSSYYKTRRKGNETAE